MLLGLTFFFSFSFCVYFFFFLFSLLFKNLKYLFGGVEFYGMNNCTSFLYFGFWIHHSGPFAIQFHSPIALNFLSSIMGVWLRMHESLGSWMTPMFVHDWNCQVSTSGGQHLLEAQTRVRIRI